jgi:hypothetical protein
VGPAAILVAGKVTWHHAAITVAGTLARQPSNDDKLIHAKLSM